MLINEIEDRINELLKASKSRVEEIISMLEGELARRESQFAGKREAEAESGKYALSSVPECKYIPKARELLAKIKALNAREMVFGNTVMALKLAFVQIYDNRSLEMMELFQ